MLHYIVDSIYLPLYVVFHVVLHLLVVRYLFCFYIYLFCCYIYLFLQLLLLLLYSCYSSSSFYIIFLLLFFFLFSCSSSHVCRILSSLFIVSLSGQKWFMCSLFNTWFFTRSLRSERSDFDLNEVEKLDISFFVIFAMFTLGVLNSNVRSFSILLSAPNVGYHPGNDNSILTTFIFNLILSVSFGKSWWTNPQTPVAAWTPRGI